MAKIKIRGELHLVFLFEPGLSRTFLQQLVDNNDEITLLIFKDRAFEQNKTTNSTENLYGWLKELKGHHLYALSGDSRYPGLGLRPSLWRGLLGHIKYIWNLIPFVAGSANYLHEHLQQLLKAYEHRAKLSSFYIRPECILPQNKKKAFRTMNEALEEWLSISMGNNIPIGWPDSLIDYLFAAPPQKTRTSLLCSEVTQMTQAMVNIKNINEPTGVALQPLPFQKSKSKRVNEGFAEWVQVIHRSAQPAVKDQGATK